MPAPEPQPEKGGINKPDLRPPNHVPTGDTRPTRIHKPSRGDRAGVKRITSTPLTDRLLAELQQEMDQPLSRDRLEQILNPTELTNEQRDFIDQWKQAARAIAARRDKTPDGAG